MRRNRTGGARGAAALACLVALCLAIPALLAVSVAPLGARPAAAAAGDVIPPRLDYSQDASELVIKRGGGDCEAEFYECPATNDVVPAGGDFTGDAAWSGDDLVFVSTRDDDAGEVYLRKVTSDTTGEHVDVHRLTCNTDEESHPVLSPDGRRIAYAAHTDGKWSVWAAELYDAPVTSDTPPRLLPCNEIRPVQVPPGAGTDLWPTWVGNSTLAFSRNTPSAHDGLADLYAVRLSGGISALVIDGDVVRLTDSEADETQPRAFLGNEGDFYAVEGWVLAFTTTQFRPDGSLATIPIDPADLRSASVQSIWPDDAPQQGSEADVSQSEGITRLAFTTTLNDPLGDLQRVDLVGPIVGGIRQLPRNADEKSVVTIADEPGRAESHAALSSASDYWAVEAVYTRRTASRDVADVVAADGSGRRSIAAGTVDVDGQAQPRDEHSTATSPDGRRLAYSRTTGASSAAEIVTARADGSDIRPLLREPVPNVVDTEPAWSPDGTRVAFVRQTSDPRLVDSTSQVWIADVAAGTATRLTQEDDPNTTIWEEQPSWSPDGERIVVGRRSLRAPADVSVTIDDPGTLGTDGRGMATVRVANASSAGRADEVTLAVSLYAWSGAVSFGETLPQGCSTVPDQSDVVRCSTETIQPGAEWTLTFDLLTGGVGAATLTADIRTVKPGDRDTGDNYDDAIIQVVNGTGPSLGPGAADATPTPPAPRLAAAGLTSNATERAENPPLQLWVSDAATGSAHALSRCESVTACLPVRGRAPAWSPDGLSVAYEAAGQVSIARLTDANGDGDADRPETVAAVRPVTGFDANDRPLPSRATLQGAADPAWSPDGSEIAVTGQPSGQPDRPGIYALRPDGSRLRALVTHRAPASEPVWQTYADLAVTVVADPASGQVELSSVVSATIANPGPARATDLTVVFDLPGGLIIGGLPSGCTASGQTVTCLVDAVPPKGSTAVRIPVTVPQPGRHPGSVAVTTDLPDPDPGNNTGEFVVTTTTPPTSTTSTTTSSTTTTSTTTTSTTTTSTTTTPPITTPPTTTPPTTTPPPISLVTALTISVRIDSPGYVGGRGSTIVTVRNSGTQPGVTGQVSISHPTRIVTVRSGADCFTSGDPCVVGPLDPGESVDLPAAVRYRAAGFGDVFAAVTAPGSAMPPTATSAPLVVRQPEVRLSPDVVAPGGVTVVTGSDFPPGATIDLGFDTGIMAPIPTLRVNDDGTLPATQMLVIRRDRLGTRAVAAAATRRGLFSAVEADLLVAPRSVAPPRFIERN